MKNYGLNLELELKHQKPEDWVFSSDSEKCIAVIPESERDAYLPTGEVQRGQEDTMDCASRAPVNILEAKFTWLLRNHLLPKPHRDFILNNGYFTESGVEFSDAFVAIVSGTTRSGNSLIAPLHAIHERGLVPKKLLPLEKTMTWDEYHDPARITPTIDALGRDFLRYFRINYERTYERDFTIVLKNDLIDVAGYAWPEPQDGEYPKVPYTPNHAFMIFKRPMAYAFDNYLDFDGDFVKKLAPDYDFMSYGYRVYIGLKDPEVKVSFWERIVAYFKRLFS